MADTVAPKMKNLPFKATALRKAGGPSAASANPDENDDLALFNRRKEMQPILESDLKRREMKRRKQKEAEERRRSSSSKRCLDADEEGAQVETETLKDKEGDQPGSALTTDESMTVKGDSFNELVTPPPSKRTRTSPSSRSREPKTPSLQSESPSASRSRLRSGISSFHDDADPARATPTGAPIISIDSDDDDEDVNPVVSPPHARGDSVEVTQGQPSQQDPADGENEFEEYIRKAEAARRESTQKPGGGGSTKSPKADLLITSMIEGAGDCLIKIFLDSKLKDARAAWAEVQRRRQVYLGVETSDLILSWRGHRMYNATTLKALGFRSYGDVLVAPGSNRKGLSADGTKVHMEMWTLEMYQKWQDEEERRRNVEAGELSEEEDGSRAVEQVPEVKLKVVLKARDMDEVKLTVRPETAVETLVAYFKSAKSLGADRSVTLWLDGDVMEEHVTMAEADIDDMDVIEVHIK